MDAQDTILWTATIRELIIKEFYINKYFLKCKK